jgi:hypothetical protein
MRTDSPGEKREMCPCGMSRRRRPESPILRRDELQARVEERSYYASVHHFDLRTLSHLS